MSHFSVLVIGPNIEEQLAPYQENNMGDCPKQFLAFQEDEDSDPDEETGKKGYWENPNAKWDYYRPGGRWAGFFKLKAGVEAAAPTPGYEASMGLQNQPESGTADVLLKGEIDWAAMRDAAGEKAAKKYDLAMSIFGDLPQHVSWPQVRAEHEGKPDTAREIYWAQARCKAWQEAGKSRRAEFDAVGFHPFYDDADQFLVSRERYVTSARNRAGTTFAVVKDGKWYERGKMGWWAYVSDEKDEETWVSMFAKLIDELPENTQLTVVDCHI
jgi:hypothetical protein